MICSLSGPDKVGRKELRQRLILYSQERFAGVVPRKYRLITFSLVNTCLYAVSRSIDLSIDYSIVVQAFCLAWYSVR